MRICTKAGDLAFKLFTFPDGQPHFKLETEDELDGRGDITVETAIRNPQELFEVLQVKDVLGNLGYHVGLDVRYLLGARMDRAIDAYQPFTLQVVARLLNGAGFTKVRILDAHSETATRLIRNSENVLPFNVAKQLPNMIFVCPDKGAVDRVLKLSDSVGRPTLFCSKVRDMQTGALSGFRVDSPVTGYGRDVLIVDDICDGGGTFVGLAKELRKVGAKSVSLFVTHGIFSKGLPLEGIDRVFTTDSYWTPQEDDYDPTLTVIPVSMQDMK
jgi:ribose-phosphate pyrophosphokinase